MAWMGSRLAALRDGYQPKKTPMRVQTANETIRALPLRTKGICGIRAVARP